MTYREPKWLRIARRYTGRRARKIAPKIAAFWSGAVKIKLREKYR